MNIRRRALEEIKDLGIDPETHILLVDLQKSGDLMTDEPGDGDEYQTLIVDLPVSLELNLFDVLAGQNVCIAVDGVMIPFARAVVDHLAALGVKELEVWDVNDNTHHQLISGGNRLYGESPPEEGTWH